MRLADQIRLDARFPSDHTDELAGAVKLAASDAVHVAASNVYDYLEGVSDPPVVDDLPCVRPAFDSSWVEFARPASRIGYRRMAAIVGHVIPLDHCDNPGLSEHFRAMGVDSMFPIMTVHDLPAHPVRGYVQILGQCFVGIDVAGQAKQVAMRPDWTEEDKLVVNEAVTIACHTFAFMHCKNVIVRNDPMDEPLVRKFRRKHGRDPVTFKTLEIIPLRRFVRGQHRPDDVPRDDRALHICRGHFKDYRKNGLFGRAKGIFWWDQHLSGTADRFVENAYDVKVS